MWGSCRAELLKLVHRPANWLMLAISVGLGLTFTYIIPYAGYLSGTPGGPQGPPNSDRGLAAVLPDSLVGNAIGGFPVFVGAIALVVGVLAVGGEYGWGTWKTILTQGPSRLTVWAAMLMTLAAAMLVLVVTMFGVGAVASAIIATVEDQPMHWPTLSDIAAGIGASWLIVMMWSVAGATLAVVLRGVALPIGLGLVWLLAVQNLLAAIAAPLLDWVRDLQKGLPGPNAGSLVASLGANRDTPGVAGLVDTGQAVIVLAAYLVACAVLGGLLLRRRDIL